MSDVVEQAVPEPEDEIQILVEGRDEIPSDTPDPVDEEKAAMRAELEAARQQRQSTDILAENFGKLNELLQEQNKPRTEPVKSEPIDEKKFAKEFINNPLNGLKKFVGSELAPELQQAFQQQRKELSDLAEELALRDESTKEVMDKYGDDVKELLALPEYQAMGKRAAYKRACREVKMDHLEDILTEAKAKWEQERTGSRGKAPLTVSGTNSPGPSSKRRVVLKPEQAARLGGVDPSYFANVLLEKEE
jgi:hypothetical protein